MMKTPEQPSDNFVYMARVSNSGFVNFILLLFSHCKREDEPTADHPQDTKTAKSIYQVESLEDSFFKQYEAYTQFVLDTIYIGDTASHFQITDKVDLITFLEEGFQQKVDEDNTESSVLDFLATMGFDNIFCFVDSVCFIVKSFDNNTIVASLDMIGSNSEGKQYRLRGENIIAIPKGKVINKKDGKPSS